MTAVKESKKKIDKLKEQRDKLNARIQAVEAREKTAERKRDTRRKVLVGAYGLEKAASTENGMADLIKRLDGYLTRDADRDLFGLPPKSDKKEKAKKAESDLETVE